LLAIISAIAAMFFIRKGWAMGRTDKRTRKQHRATRRRATTSTSSPRHIIIIRKQHVPVPAGPGPWAFKDPDKADDFAVPCLACHEMHSPNTTQAQSAPVDKRFQSRNPGYSLYSRPDKMHLRVDMMAQAKMYHDGKEVMISEDPVEALCVRCHSSNHAHEAGTEDDHTLVGVHEGMSCSACHEPHSNNPMNSCSDCHPIISNCNLEVQTMDTTFADPDSSNNIHSVSCKNCHEDEWLKNLSAGQ
jgi:hypothetical protein